MHLCPAVSGKPGCSVPKDSRAAGKVYERYFEVLAHKIQKTGNEI